MAKVPTLRAGEAVTKNYGWVKPTVGASIDAWGGYINTDLDGIDAVVHGIDTRVIPPGVAIVSDTPPVGPTPGMLWFDSVGGQTYVWYSDANSSQWAPTTNQMGGGYATTAYVDASVNTARINDNRIINGDMRIDQRNGGAEVAPLSGITYTVDRWFYQSTQTSKLALSRQNIASPNFGFGYFLQTRVLSQFAPAATDYFILAQNIEADMIADLSWGSAAANPVTLSFWAVSSLGGTFSGSLSNTDGTRSYPFSYVLPVSTWAKIVVTIPGDTAGTWVLQGNGMGLTVRFDLGCGANFHAPAGAWAAGNFIGANGAASLVATTGYTYLTGVKLEIGSVATPFNRQSLAKSMVDCQRYYQSAAVLLFNSAWSTTAIMYPLKVTMRATPTMVTSNIVAGSGGTYSSIDANTLIQNAANTIQTTATVAASAEL